MSAYLVHRNATVQCTHQGLALPVATNLRVKVNGQQIVTLINTYTIPACPNPPNAGGRCATAKWLAGASRVKAGGAPVVLKDSKSLCAPTGVVLNVKATQTRVKGT
jgi:hypothetical protein